MSGISSEYPFTAAQWQELEHQALFFKFMVSGLPIPTDLVYNINGRKNPTSQPHHFGWACFQSGTTQNIDPEPTRCKRTDGKKWRCSRQTNGDSKYCERHVNRGKSRPRRKLQVPESKPMLHTFASKSSSIVDEEEARKCQQFISLSSVSSDMPHHQSHQLFNTHLTKPVKYPTFMTFDGMESGWTLDKSEKREIIMYQFIEESPQA